MSWQLGHWWPLREWFQWSAGGNTSRLRSCERSAHGDDPFKKLDGKEMETVWQFTRRSRGFPDGPMWLRICLPMRGTRVWSLVLELRSRMPWGRWPVAATTKPSNSRAGAPQPEKAHAPQWRGCASGQRTSTAKKKKSKKKSKADLDYGRLKKKILISLKGPQTEESSVSR